MFGSHDPYGLFNHLPHGYCVLNKDLKVIFWNAVLEHWSGLARKDVLGKPLQDFCPKLKEGIYEDRFKLAIDLSVPAVFSAQIHKFVIPCPLDSDDEDYQTHQTYLLPLDSGDLVILIENVSKTQEVMSNYRKLVTKLKVAERKALAAERSKSSFLANMSHEIRTLLNGIIGLCEEIAAETKATSPHYHLLDLVIQSGHNLTTIINDILDYSKIEAHKLELSPSVVSVKEVLAGTLTLYQGMALARHVGLELDVADSMKLVSVDKMRLQQIVGNLVSNGIKFSEGGQVLIQAKLDEDTPPQLDIQIKDSGIGISEKQLVKFFKPFSQADHRTSERYGGTGLGLSIVKSLTELMRGTIHVESELGVGTRFLITLPVEIAEGISLPVLEMLSQDHKASLDLKHLNVLVAEDNRVNSLVTERFLKHYGISADFVENGEQAVTMVQTKAYDLVLMDCYMPQVDGYQATQRIRQLNLQQQPYIVALTASVLEDDLQLCLDSGMNEVMAKSIMRPVLESVLKNLPDAVPKHAELIKKRA
ncbi:ATP-binding protein [Pseudobacteriovorax antillogorgiicola]|uniref:histidine kinase n=1 Tax=Pseudobacteriovorax antillogorgiicola TaxID=1513793 RepID=A0A1Y6CK68_9BACT|nr:ATP-binding protein [Pseudobacteriovorax antillogorgiicola]TCS47594.1 PAS domain-containing protein [Pseudobacteriovorax antillogorgiicola]SMF60190.1 PAS fold-containing protein [Pseudobacteriovorax antillogorgiicola]